MQKSQEINVNVKETVEHSVAGNREFHFYVDELAADNSMPTYVGKADEKYTYEEMDDDFFEFLERKSHQDGIYVRLVFSMSVEKKMASNSIVYLKNRVISSKYYILPCKSTKILWTNGHEIVKMSN